MVVSLQLASFFDAEADALATQVCPSPPSSPAWTPAPACPSIQYYLLVPSLSSCESGPWHGPSAALTLSPNSGVLYIPSASALNAILSASVVLLNVSYSIPVALLLIRGRHLLRPPSFPEPTLTMGPILGPIANVVGLVFTVFTTAFFIFPPEFPATAENMNCELSAPEPLRRALIPPFRRRHRGIRCHLRRRGSHMDLPGSQAFHRTSRPRRIARARPRRD